MVMSYRDEWKWSTIVQGFLDMGVQNVVITLDSNGAYFANEMVRGHALAYLVTTEDTTGAG